LLAEQLVEGEVVQAWSVGGALDVQIALHDVELAVDRRQALGRFDHDPVAGD
jgi:hypothetical protein